MHIALQINPALNNIGWLLESDEPEEYFDVIRKQLVTTSGYNRETKHSVFFFNRTHTQ